MVFLSLSAYKIMWITCNYSLNRDADEALQSFGYNCFINLEQYISASLVSPYTLWPDVLEWNELTYQVSPFVHKSFIIFDRLLSSWHETLFYDYWNTQRPNTPHITTYFHNHINQMSHWPNWSADCDYSYVALPISCHQFVEDGLHWYSTFLVLENTQNDRH